MKKFRLLNNIFGWVAFAIAATTYLLTIEPTASFWDCGEFISTATKLDVGHSPGAPFFMLTAHFFTLFASDPQHIAAMVNSMSALLSAFTILFLFWTITHIARKVVIKSEENYTTANIIAILGSGMVGALAYTFSDSFWFSAVEGEVYAYSSFFTAIVFWLIFKWERVADRPGSDRWLILIAYLMGISIGVHLLNLLSIPALVLVYYFKNYKPSVKSIILAFVVTALILVVVLYGIIPGSVQMACWLELFFVNTLGFAYNTGLYIYILLAVLILAWGIYESYTGKSNIRMIVSFILSVTIVGIPFFGNHFIVGLFVIAGMILFFYYKKWKVNTRWLNTIITMITVLMIGYSSYSVIVIRSSANPTMDQNSPDNVFALQYYLNREQYGNRPLLYGAVYNAPVKLKVEGNMCVPEMKQGDPLYSPKPKSNPSEKDEYVLTGYNSEYVMNEKFNMFFPRMYYNPNIRQQQIEAYKSWGNVKGEKVDYDYCNQQRSDYKPTFGENLRFFFNYQLNYMYWRYFMWNFSGRQNDLQGNGEIDKGNWITGISFIDNYLVGNQTNLPSELKNNKGRNTYFMLPLILGIFGLIFLIYGGSKGVEEFWITTLLFVLTGIAIVVYLNQTPYQPRERDYAYVGSFYAFSIWIGLGVLGIIKFLRKYLPKTATAGIVTVCCLGVPTIMAQQNWNDHDRSGRYTCRDFGRNYLDSCKPNAIIFTMGDNDTFPLWYNQEVEGVRTDVRVCNLSYLQTDWYINQMKRGAYKSAPLPIKWDRKDYISGKNEIVDVDSVIPEVDLKTAFDFLLSSDPQTKYNGESFIPTKHLFLPVDAQQVIASGTLPEKRAAEILPRIDINLKNSITKSDLMILELLKENNWKRPIYFAVSIGGDYLGLTDHFERTGMAYQILPVGIKGSGPVINTDEMYTNLMTKFKYGGIDNPDIYLDETILNMCKAHRMMFVYLANALVSEGDSVRAKKALDYCIKVIPSTTVKNDYISVQIAYLYYRLGEPEKANKIMDDVAQNCVENLDWCFSLSPALQNRLNERIGENYSILNQILRICDSEKQKVIMDKFLPRFMDYSKRVQV